MEENSHEIDVTPEVIRNTLDMNREIEFALNGHMYFLQPRTNRPIPPRYAILDCEQRKWIFEGSLEELNHFVFPGGYTLADHFDCFDFLYFL